MMERVYQRHGTPFREKSVRARQPLREDFIPYEPALDDDDNYTPRVMKDDIEFGDGELHSPIDAFINMEVLLAHGGEERIARVVGRAKDEDGNYVGHHNDNPILNT